MTAAAVVAWLRDADWLTAERAQAYARILTIAMLVCLAAAVAKLGTEAASDPHGLTVVRDFEAFWSSARMALQGRSADVYNVDTFTGVERESARIDRGGYLPYLYPPTFLLLSLPLAFLPYLAAMAAFLAAGYAATSLLLKRLLPPGWPWLPVLAFPASIMNVIITQNGFLSAICFAGASLLLEARPWLAGICLGMLAYKPQLAIYVPFLLVAGRRWRALAACGATAGCLVLLSWCAFGAPAWVAFLDALPQTRAVLQTHPEIAVKLISVYSALRLFHAGIGTAYAAQFMCALLALAAVIWAGFKRAGARLEIATLVAATFVSTPYAMDYDLVCFGVPLAAIAAQAQQSSWRAWEKPVLLVAYAMPLGARLLNVGLHIPIVPPVVLGVLAILWMRTRRTTPGLTAQG